MRVKRKNNLGLLGWALGGRYRLERYAYTLHRITGVGLVFYFVMHIIVTGSRIGGPEKWEQTMALYETPWFKFGEFLVFIAFSFHAINGIRLALTELGVWLGKAQRPLYPYVTSIHRQRPVLIAIMVLTALLILIGGADFYLLGH